MKYLPQTIIDDEELSGICIATGAQYAFCRWGHLTRGLSRRPSWASSRLYRDSFPRAEVFQAFSLTMIKTLVVRFKANGLAAIAYGIAIGYNPVGLKSGRGPTQIETVKTFRPQWR
ncbi:hypothetical protein [Prolixibacter sp. NT017]|uniref:hypothetical protein n=1 Tax=Prolixibacter sp. NT017 TaxID=2652390 RepID=UPI00129923F3|nr:hypothetical protein [Prolixibacter sp. NT017]